MNKRKIYYVAYGSNLHLGQMAYRCPGATVVGTATLEDWRLMFKGSKTGFYATIEPYPGESVPVLLWEISSDNERSLDRYEGYPVFYHKKTFKFVLDNKEIEAMAYIMRKDAKVGYPSQRYIDTLLTGYTDFDFDKKILNNALLRCKCD